MWGSNAAISAFRIATKRAGSESHAKILLSSLFHDSYVPIFRIDGLHSSPKLCSQASPPSDFGSETAGLFSEDHNVHLPDMGHTINMSGDPAVDNIVSNFLSLVAVHGTQGAAGVLDDNIAGSGVNNDNQACVKMAELDRGQLDNVLNILQNSANEHLESSLGELSLPLSEKSAVQIIQTPNILGEKIIRFFKWVTEQPNFTLSNRLVQRLVRAVGISCREEDGYLLWDLIKEIDDKEKGIITTGILNHLISVFWKLHKGKDALEVFNKFEEFACMPDVSSYYLTFEALSDGSFFDDAWTVCEKLLSTGNLPGIKKVGRIIVSLCQRENAKDAHFLYLFAKENQKYPPKSSIDILISRLCRDDETVHLARDMLEDFPGDTRRYAIKPFLTVLRALSRTDKVDDAKRLLLRMIEFGPPPGNGAFNGVISGLSKLGKIDDAISLKQVMERRGLRPDVYTSTVIISAYARDGKMDEAYKMFCELKTVHSKLCRVTYNILIRGYCKLEKFERALECLREMKEDGIEPNCDEYNKLIQSLCLKALDWRAADALLEEMKQKGLHLSKITHRLIKAVKDLEEEALKGGTSAEA